MPFVKLDRGILTSTIWCLRPELEVFMTALLMAEPREFTSATPTIKIRSLDDAGWDLPPGWYGFVAAAGPGIVRASHVDAEKGMEALEHLSQPEQESRSQEYDGRRMVRINGGFVVLNFMKYRDFDHSAADRMRRLRERRKRGVTANCDGVQANVTHSREQRAESREQITKTVGTRATALADNEWIASLKTNPAYEGIDTDREIAKCRTWHDARGRRSPSRRAIVNWLNKVEKPVGVLFGKVRTDPYAGRPKPEIVP